MRLNTLPEIPETWQLAVIDEIADNGADRASNDADYWLRVSERSEIVWKPQLVWDSVLSPRL